MVKKERRVVVTLKLDNWLADALEKKAKKDGITVYQEVRKGLREGLKKKLPEFPKI